MDDAPRSLYSLMLIHNWFIDDELTNFLAPIYDESIRLFGVKNWISPKSIFVSSCSLSSKRWINVDPKQINVRCRQFEIRAKFFFADFLAWLDRARRVTYKNVVFKIIRSIFLFKKIWNTIIRKNNTFIRLWAV